MAIDDNTSYELTGAQVKDLAAKIKAKADDNIFVGATSAAPGSKGIVPAPQAADDTKFLAGDGTWATPTDTTYTAGTNVSISAQNVISATDTTYSAFTGATASVAGSAGLVPAPAAGDEGKVLHGDGTWKDTTAKLVEMSYGEANSWAKFIAAYNAGSIVYCRASSNANPATGSQTRKAFMAYVNNATSPTNVEFQYVRSNSSKTDSQQCDQVFVYTLTNSNGGTWSVASRDMATKINVDSTLTKTYSSGANASMTLKAKAMTGATSGTAGTAGYVPAPASGDDTAFLKGNGTWARPNGVIKYGISGYIATDSTITMTEAPATFRSLMDGGMGVVLIDDDLIMYQVLSADLGVATIVSKAGEVIKLTSTALPDTYNVERTITMTSTDPGEGGSLAAGNFIFVYEV